MRFAIFDKGLKGRLHRRYIPRCWETIEEAERELRDLLRPYEQDHIWRKRLFVEGVRLSRGGEPTESDLHPELLGSHRGAL